RARTGRGSPRFLPRPDRVLQSSAIRPLRGYVPHDGEQESAEVPDPRAGDQGARSRRRGAASYGVAGVGRGTSWRGRGERPLLRALLEGAPGCFGTRL